MSITLQRWDYNTHAYHPHKLPDGNYKTYGEDMEEIVNCAQCGKQCIYGNCYTSMEVHTELGIGYEVCEECYEEEMKRRMEDMHNA